MEVQGVKILLRMGIALAPLIGARGDSCHLNQKNITASFCFNVFENSYLVNFFPCQKFLIQSPLTFCKYVCEENFYLSTHFFKLLLRTFLKNVEPFLFLSDVSSQLSMSSDRGSFAHPHF